MKQFAKPRILISRCLEHEACRYDGSMIRSDIIKGLKPYVDFVTVCPEMQIGLPSPREAMRIVRKASGEEHLLSSQSGIERTPALKAFTEDFIEHLDVQEIDGIILKEKSPSCGINDVKIYDGIGKAKLIPGKTKGLFGGALIQRLPLMPIENEGRLRHFNLREQFLIRIYTQKAFKEVKKSGEMKALVQFQSINKYLFMSFSPGYLKALGKLVANHEKRKFSDLIVEYEEVLSKLLAQDLSPARNVNTLLHVYGYFKDDISAEEKAYFLEKMDLYRQKKIPYMVVLNILGGWAIRFDETYLKGQTLFEPFPQTLFDVTDSGKGL